jgi:nucleotide-binding universal stress UspA family protein
LPLFTHSDNDAWKYARIVQRSTIATLHRKLIVIEVISATTQRAKTHALSHMTVLHRFTKQKEEFLREVKALSQRNKLDFLLKIGCI